MGWRFPGAGFLYFQNSAREGLEDAMQRAKFYLIQPENKSA
jgi:hypothetical protein